MLSGDIFDDLLGDDGDSDNSKPAGSKKSNKKKSKKPVVADELDNEVDAAINEVDGGDETRPAGAASDDDDDESEEGGILELLDGESNISI